MVQCLPTEEEPHLIGQVPTFTDDTVDGIDYPPVSSDSLVYHLL